MRSGATVMLLLLVSLARAQSAHASSQPPDYLSVGDSVSFGYDPTLDKQNPTGFVGYPEEVAQSLGIQVANASCPGETAGHFISVRLPDNACGLYRGLFPLHIAYTGDQLSFAIAFLHAHPSTSLITVSIGANDVFLLQNNCAALASPTCFGDNLRAVLTLVAARLSWILSQIRNEAGYGGKIVTLAYYTRDYSNPAEVLVVTALNAYLASVTAAFGGAVADGFEAFRQAALAAGGSACAAGLLIVDSASPLSCDVHPSPAGRHLLAQAVLRAAS